MQLEAYIDFSDFEDHDQLYVQGSRINLEVIVGCYLNGLTADEIVSQYPPLTPEQVHGTLAYYLHNRDFVDSYLSRCTAWSQRMREEQDKQDLPPALQRLRELRSRKDAA